MGFLHDLVGPGQGSLQRLVGAGQPLLGQGADGLRLLIGVLDDFGVLHLRAVVHHVGVVLGLPDDAGGLRLGVGNLDVFIPEPGEFLHVFPKLAGLLPALGEALFLFGKGLEHFLLLLVQDAAHLLFLRLHHSPSLVLSPARLLLGALLGFGQFIAPAAPSGRHADQNNGQHQQNGRRQQQLPGLHIGQKTVYRAGRVRHGIPPELGDILHT